MKILWLGSLKPEEIAVSRSLFRRFLKPQSLVVNIGSLKLKLDVVLKEDLPKDTIGLPKDLSQVYTIPTDLPYETIINNGEIRLGPVIAYVDQRRFKNLNHRIYFSILPKFMDYHAINGLIFICTQDSIDMEKDIIEGYYFDPHEKDQAKVWKHGYFPMPDALFNRSFMNKKRIAAIREKIGDTVFNSSWFNLNKLKIWQNLSEDKVLQPHLPYTEKYIGAEQLKRFLQDYGSVYLKPFQKSRGRGIMKVTRTGKGTLVEHNTMKKRVFENNEDLAGFLKERIKIPYIVQQAVPFKLNNRQVDFRLILQKDDSRKWRYCGLMARIAPVGGIITNMRGRPVTLVGREALEKLFKFNEETIEKVERKMTDLVIRAAEKYEEKGLHLGDLAADLILDADLHIWLLELQLNHAIYGNTNILPAEFFKLILTNPFKYAKALAGFK